MDGRAYESVDSIWQLMKLEHGHSDYFCTSNSIEAAIDRKRKKDSKSHSRTISSQDGLPFTDEGEGVPVWQLK